MFHFKQFSVDQSGCAMKINTDGVLLGALTQSVNPQIILDIGTGTGVVALMLAQRFTHATVNAVEIAETAAITAAGNFAASPFSTRMKIHHQSFQGYFKSQPDKRYDLIVSNPPFYINALQSPGAAKKTAKHADRLFFEDLISDTTGHLTPEGRLALILPIDTAKLVVQLASARELYLQSIIKIKSYPESTPHRQLLTFGFSQIALTQTDFIIYSEPRVHSAQYRAALLDFFTIF